MEACVNQVVVGGGSRKGQYWINSPAIAASATDAAIVSCPSPPLPRELFSTAAPNSCCMPEGDLGSSLVRQSGVCSRSTATTWLTRPQWQGSAFGAVLPTKSLGSIPGPELRPWWNKSHLWDDQEKEHWTKDDLQSYQSAAVCLHRRLPQVYGMQNIDYCPTLETKG